ncbi:E3 ubiquitin-protein ligase TRIM39-like [Lissotriton helveticus]
MAEANPVEHLMEETRCAICLDYYTDPVTTQCGHNFCRPCIAGCWAGLTSNFPCPECRKASPKGALSSNRQLANIVQIARDFSQQAAQLRVEGECGLHREKLRLFCRKEETAICVVCREAKEHRAHEAVPLEEAALEYKGKLKTWLDPLKQEKKDIQEHQSIVEKRATALQTQIAKEKKRTLAEFDRLYQILRNKEQIFLSHLEEMDKKITVARDANMTKLSDEISHLNELIVEMQEKMTWPAEEFLKDVKDALKRCEDVKFRKPEEKRKYYKVYATMDPTTANPCLGLSADRRSVRFGGGMSEALPSSRSRLVSSPYTALLCVLGCEALTSRRLYWEVEVSGGNGWSVGGNWRVGVAKHTARTKDTAIAPSPVVGIWAVERRRQQGTYQALTLPVTTLTLRANPKKIGLFLDYEAGRLSFYNADSSEHIYTFRDSFTRTLLPYFGVCNKTELRLI